MVQQPPLKRRFHEKERSTFLHLFDEGGPGFCQFAINNACNAQCRFCGFGLSKQPHKEQKYVPRNAALQAIEILYRYGIRYLVITGGEPLLHRNLEDIIRRASGLKMTVVLVTNGSLLIENTVRRLADAGVTTFIISIDAATVEKHEANRGLPGVCGRIRRANRTISTMTRSRRRWDWADRTGRYPVPSTATARSAT